MPPNQPPRLKYSKKLSAIGATSTAILALGAAPASAAVVTVTTDVRLSYATNTYTLAFLPTGESFVTTWPASEAYPVEFQMCNLRLLATSPDVQIATVNLQAGDSVGPSLTYSGQKMQTVPQPGQTIYLGYKYTPNSQSGGTDTYYGFAKVSGAEVFNNTAYHVDYYAYESTPNTTVIVPEASSALLAFAGAGLLFRRRRA